jgi:arabinofuranosyltransferase
VLIWDDVTDDAYISFRYVERWVEGLGLTFNPGERVEGFSNPLWVGLLAAVRWLVPAVAIADAARGLGFAAAVVSLLSMAAALRRSNPGRESVAVTYAAIIRARRRRSTSGWRRSGSTFIWEKPWSILRRPFN